MRIISLLLGLGPALAAILAPSADAQTLTDVNLQVDTVDTPIAFSTGIRFLGVDDALVIEKNTGKVKRVQGVAVSEVLDLDVRGAGEMGLIGIELHPDFDPDDANPNDYVYLYYSAPMMPGDDNSPPLNGNWAKNRLSRFTWNGTSLVDETQVFSIDFDAAQNNGPVHNGGPMRFGPDGKLYLATGDLKRNRAEQNNSAAAAMSALTGGIYRLNDDGTIPADNPFITHPDPSFHGLYAYGVRNSFGLAFDPVTAELWATENGPGTMDEVNLVEAGFNSGWRILMGPESRDPDTPDDLVDLTPGTSTYSDPEFSFEDTIGITSIEFLAGSALGPAYDDAVIVGESYGRAAPPSGGNLYVFRLAGSRNEFVLAGDMADRVEDPGDDVSQILFGVDFGLVTDIQIGPDGSLYVLGVSGQIRRISRIPTEVPVLHSLGRVALSLALIAVARFVAAGRPRGSVRSRALPRLLSKGRKTSARIPASAASDQASPGANRRSGTSSVGF